MPDNHIQFEGGVSSPVIAVIECRDNGAVELIDAVNVHEGQEVTIVPSPRGGIVLVGTVTALNEGDVMSLILGILSNPGSS